MRRSSILAGAMFIVVLLGIAPARAGVSTWQCFRDYVKGGYNYEGVSQTTVGSPKKTNYGASYYDVYSNSTCTTQIGQKYPAGKLRIKAQLQFKFAQEWSFCQETAWAYNSVGGGFYNPPRASKTTTYAPCGAGRTYRVVGIPQYHNGAAWVDWVPSHRMTGAVMAL